MQAPPPHPHETGYEIDWTPSRNYFNTNLTQMLLPTKGGTKGGTNEADVQFTTLNKHVLN